nr:MAG TPA: hypothetical protein [Inoviridae sp.]
MLHTNNSFTKILHENYNTNFYSCKYIIVLLFIILLLVNYFSVIFYHAI